MSRWEKYHRKKFKEMQEKVHRLAKVAVKGKTPEEIERLIADWRQRFSECERTKVELEKDIDTFFWIYFFKNIRNDQETSQKLSQLLSALNFAHKIKIQNQELFDASSEKLFNKMFQKEKLKELEIKRDEARNDYVAFEERLKVFVSNVVVLCGNKSVERDPLINEILSAPLEMSIQWPQQKYDGTIPKTSAEDILKFIEDNAKLPKVEISGDDFLIYKLQNEFFQHLKKAIPNAAKQKKLARLKAQAAKNSEEQRGLSSSLRNDKNFQKQMSKFNFCPYCETKFSTKTLTDKIHMDHIYPVSKGGHSVIENLVFICDQCNIKKSDQTLTRFSLSTGFDTDSIIKRLIALDKDI